jgi:predicted AAA+ superfamily ATPase
MFRENEFTKTGRKNKSSIEQIIENKSMGITNMEKLYKTMKEAGIIQKITNAQVNFSIHEGNKLLNLSLEDFIEELKKQFNSKPKNFLLNY